jgi:DNA polymerase sigma
MYGSMANGLAIDTSDVDLIVTGVSNNISGGRTNLLRMMDKLHMTLQKEAQNVNSLFQEINFIDTSLIPVIKLKANL